MCIKNIFFNRIKLMYIYRVVFNHDIVSDHGANRPPLHASVQGLPGPSPLSGEARPTGRILSPAFRAPRSGPAVTAAGHSGLVLARGSGLSEPGGGHLPLQSIGYWRFALGMGEAVQWLW